jgi:Nitrile hydratase beta subunit, C-terminal
MARFQPGERVAVRMADPPGHIRTPWYCRGKFGVIERICGSFDNPESLAYGLGGAPARPLYRVRFDQRALWPDYHGAAKDTVEIEIYEHWLVPAKEGADA